MYQFPLVFILTSFFSFYHSLSLALSLSRSPSFTVVADSQQELSDQLSVSCTNDSIIAKDQHLLEIGTFSSCLLLK